MRIISKSIIVPLKIIHEWDYRLTLPANIRHISRIKMQDRPATAPGTLPIQTFMAKILPLTILQ